MLVLSLGMMSAGLFGVHIFDLYRENLVGSRRSTPLPGPD